MNEVKNYHGQKAEPLYADGFLSKLAKLISNLTYLQKKHVDYAILEKSECKYIGVILAHTRMDDRNPTLREWSLMIIRNMC